MMMPSLFNRNTDLFDDFFGDTWFPEREMRNAERELYGHRANRVMNTDVKETDNAYEVEMDLPGFKKDEVTAKLHDGYLTIQASKGLDKDEQDKDGKYIRRERYAGSCSRSFYVGTQVKQSDLKAKFEDGILKISIPKVTPEAVEQNSYIAIEG